jgi:hypothetical protein
MEIFGIKNEPNGEPFKSFVEMILSNQVHKTIRVIPLNYRQDLAIWVYRVMVEVDGVLEDMSGSPELFKHYRVYLHKLYRSNPDQVSLKYETTLPMELYNGGFAMIEADLIPMYTLPIDLVKKLPSDIYPESRLLRTIYWVIRGWAKIANIIDNTVPPPRIHPDLSVTVVVNDIRQAGFFFEGISNSLNENGSSQLKITKLSDNLEAKLRFRCQAGHPLIIDNFGVKQDSRKPLIKNPLKTYQEWLTPCLDPQVPISWEEMGRLVYYQGRCFAIDDDPEHSSIAKFMTLTYHLAQAGVYPLGPFRGLVQWPYRPPTKLLTYQESLYTALPSLPQPVV